MPKPGPICEPMSAIRPGIHPDHLKCSAYVCVNSAAALVVKTARPNVVEHLSADLALQAAGEHCDGNFVVKDSRDESVARRPCTAEVGSEAGTCM